MDETPSAWNYCPCCGTQFGYHDSGRSHSQLRQEWIATGMRWWSPIRLAPKGWNSNVQLFRRDLSGISDFTKTAPRRRGTIPAKQLPTALGQIPDWARAMAQYGKHTTGQLGPESEEPSSAYANNAYLEPSVWDLKIIFGQLHGNFGNPDVDWHTEITMPWLQAKLFSYFLNQNIIVYEIENGKIRIPQALMPPAPNLMPGIEGNPATKKIAEALTASHEKFRKEQVD